MSLNTENVPTEATKKVNPYDVLKKEKYDLIGEKKVLEKENEKLRNEVSGLKELSLINMTRALKAEENLERANEMIMLLKQRIESLTLNNPEKIAPSLSEKKPRIYKIEDSLLNQNVMEKSVSICVPVEKACKFDKKCTNDTCTYSHSGTKMKDIMCRSGSNCPFKIADPVNNKKACGFKH